jgi:hypothetical protein
MSELGQKAKNSLGANVFHSSSNNGPWDSGTDCGCMAAHRRSPSAPPLYLKGQFKFEFNKLFAVGPNLEKVELHTWECLLLYGNEASTR